MTTMEELLEFCTLCGDEIEPSLFEHYIDSIESFGSDGIELLCEDCLGDG